MKENESVKDYVDKLMKIVNQVRFLGAEISDARIMEKVLVSILERFESKIAALEESKNLTLMTMQKLKFKASVALKLGCKVKCLRTDNGGEFTYDEFEAFLSITGILLELVQEPIENPNDEEFVVRGIKTLESIYDRCNMAITDPTSYSKAKELAHWQATMKKELRVIDKNKTWSLVDRTDSMNVIGTKWIFRTKFNIDGSINKHKARLVVQGYVQRLGIDFTYTFTPVARFETVKLLLAITGGLS
ncbi:uncharacterized protein LOC110410383 [Herrania umbratica]|uniref:Uncharacterized protein LOC110410383 n=1 Tax=Herrania umbratica TaxID=108875 RepID=A0A6J0ZMM6_9ROSI|nr:uncharacterized protein LOC110410383 [Herrania umbratica]